MGGYSGDARTRLGLIALLAMRRAKAERLRRGEDESGSEGDATDDDFGPIETAPKPRRRLRWF